MFLLLLSTDSPYCRCMCVFPLSSGLRLSAGLTTALSSGRLNSLTPSELSSLVRALYYDGEPRTRFLQLLASVTGGDMESAERSHCQCALSARSHPRRQLAAPSHSRRQRARGASGQQCAVTRKLIRQQNIQQDQEQQAPLQRIKDAIRETKSRIQEQARAYEPTASKKRRTKRNMIDHCSRCLPSSHLL